MDARPILRRPGEGRSGEMPGEKFTGKLRGDDTQGFLALAEYELAPGSGTVEHRHLRSGELFFVLTGTAVFDVDGEEYEAASGSTLWVPPGAAHRISNLTSAPVTMLGAFAPAGPEALFPALMELHQRTNGNPSPEEVAEVRKRFDIQPVGPSRFGREA
jgi:quercetin dioxygenase-like cupin family protein